MLWHKRGEPPPQARGLGGEVAARGGGRSDGAGSRSDDVSEMSDESEKSEKGGEEAELETEEGAEHVEGDEGLSRLLREWRAREQAKRLERGNAKRAQGKGRGKSNQEQGAPAARDIRSMFRVVKSECCRERCPARLVMCSSNNVCLSMHWLSRGVSVRPWLVLFISAMASSISDLLIAWRWCQRRSTQILRKKKPEALACTRLPVKLRAAAAAACKGRRQAAARMRVCTDRPPTQAQT